MLRFRITADPGANGPACDRLVEVALREELVLGRQQGADIELPFLQVSARHAKILFAGPDRISVIDLGSCNGTFVNERRLLPDTPHSLVPGDALRLARVSLVFEGAGRRPPGSVSEGTTTLGRRLVGDLFAMCRPAQSASLSVEGSETQPLLLSSTGRLWRIGRGPTCHLVLADPDVSREHAEVVRDAEGLFLCDLGSMNGLLINGKPVARRAQLHDGDVVRLGNSTLRFADPEERYLRQMEQATERDDAPAKDRGPLCAAMTAAADAEDAPSDRSGLSRRADPRVWRWIPRMAMTLAALALVGVVALLLALALTWNR